MSKLDVNVLPIDFGRFESFRLIIYSKGWCV